MTQGANVTYLDPSGSQLGHKESFKDTARVLGRMFDAIEYRGASAGRRRDAREVRRRACLQRPHRRVPPDADARRRDDDARAQRQADPRHQIRLHRRHPLQHGPLADDRRLPDGHGCAHLRPKSLWPVRRVREDCARTRSPLRGEADDHRRPQGRGGRGGFHPYRRLGLDGRAEGGVGGAHRAADALPGQHGADEGERQSAR